MPAIKKEISELKQQIRKHDYLYYVLNKPEISDYEYDALMKRLADLEKKYPKLITPDSPTQRVGGTPLKEFKTVRHSSPMLSLENTYSAEGIREWEKRIKKILGQERYEFVIEPKIDGVSCALVYKDGAIALGATRGDGETGEDVTLNIKTIKSIPLSLICKKPPALFEARGEVFIDRNDFEKLNRELKSSGSEPFANPRNAAAGSLRQKNPSVTAKRKLKFFAHSPADHEAVIIEGRRIVTHYEFLKLCSAYGLPAPGNLRLCNSLDEAVDACMKWQGDRKKLGYDIDGMVIKINSFEQRKKLGWTMKSPRWAIAYKFPATQATTKIINIRVQVGRTGIVTPVADLQPVQCGGVTISHSTLHNFDEIKRLGVRAGDTVLIERAGEVIPKIVRVIESKRTGAEKPFSPPAVCPECGGKIVKEEEEVGWRCINPSCPAQLERGIVHFAKREAMDIEGLGEAVVEQLVSGKNVSDFADVYFLKKEDLLGLELFKEKKAENLLKALQASKGRGLARLLFGLGIRHVGEKAAITLAGRFGDIRALMEAGAEELTAIDEIGPVMANSITDFFSQPSTKKLIRKLGEAGVNMKGETKREGTGAESKLPFSDKTFVFTGELETMTRYDAETKVRQLGGNPSSVVSKKTGYVVAGKNPGSKYAKA
ncbi:MAG: NAD-dependent DNA ligase LigA, partial [Elusimicrobia bacterium]|nr:NAD-dependent DNA ligase LigA [Elusimicrobiota bacterium]